MPHARPETGVLKTGLGIHIFPSPVDFGSDLGPANILITLAAKDSDTHIEVIQALMYSTTSEHRSMYSYVRLHIDVHYVL